MLILSFLYHALTLALIPYFGLMAMVAAAALTQRFRRVNPVVTATESLKRFIVVIPAHDEEADIAATVASCRSLEYNPRAVRVVVIADNCTDATAKAARDAGAEVLERVDHKRRSKGFALEYFFEHLASTGQGGSFDAVVVIDADTVVAPDLLTRFSEALDNGADWIQSYYSVSNPDRSWRTRLLTYAFSLFNGVWLLGQDRLGLSVGFRGNGMCFSAKGLARVPWKAYGLVEDQEFSWMLRVAGERVRFLADTGVFGEMVSRGKAAVSQRSRWENGRNALVRRFFRPIVTSRNLSVVEKTLAVLDLTFPPMMRLATLLLLAVTVHPLASALPSLERLSVRLFPFHAAMALTFAAYALSPFLSIGLPWRYMKSLSAVPYYLVWKFFATFRARTGSWVRTQRESVTNRGSI